ncbi:unnamed protein product [Acanthosepion pharaonis]|uniref:Uncharacterized protein n=1 Tax=Acanthosepion pharaonis TaxID=158019 RepID=A0A812BTJ6_ACAPH|nr:unnamed protein product [Sepia pharaonis]
MCNGQHKCQLDGKKSKNCSISYYCIDDRFVQNCSLMNAPTNIGNNLDLFWCYQHTSQKKGKPRCWEFSRDVNHHWFILRGLVKMKLGVSSHGKLIENFKMIKSIKSNEICTSSKYIWIIYVGTKNPETLVNIYSEDDPTLTDSRQIDDINTNTSKEVIKFERNMTEDSQNNFFAVDDNKNQDNKSENMNFVKIIIIIATIGGVLIAVAITIAILWCCCRRCNNVTISNPRKNSSSRKNSFSGKISHKVNKVETEEPNCQLRKDFVPTEATRDTFDSVGFWTDDEDYVPDDDRHSKIKPHIYAMGNCIYEQQSPTNEIYMNSVIPPPSSVEKEKEMYVNMQRNQTNKHFNIFL